MKLLNEFRQQYNLAQLETHIVEEAPSRFRYNVSYTHQGKKFVGEGPRLTKKKAALRSAEYELCRQLAPVLGVKGTRSFLSCVDQITVVLTCFFQSDKGFVELFNLAAHHRETQQGASATSEETEAFKRMSRQQDEARIKKVFHWVGEEHIEPLLQSQQDTATDSFDLLHAVGSKLVGGKAAEFYEVLQKSGWTDKIRDYDTKVSSDSSTRNNDILAQVLREDAEDEAAEPADEITTTAVEDESAATFVSQASLDAKFIDIGYWRRENEFVSLWKTSHTTVVDFNKNAYVLSLQFMRHQVAYKIRNLLREMAEPVRYDCHVIFWAMPKTLLTHVLACPQNGVGSQLNLSNICCIQLSPS